MSSLPLIRVGVEGGRRAVLAQCRNLGAPILVSANSMWDNRRHKFTGIDAYRPFNVALDSGGFVAMRRYNGKYRFTADEYATLAADLAPAWWAQMDYCCEPELASDSAAVAHRIDLTVAGLHTCQAAALTAGAPPPLPVLQGWKPADYTSGPAWDPSFVWPALVGVGSVCRRPIEGPTGILAVVAALHEKLPPHVQLHLFGVKSGAAAACLARFPGRLASVDSMAWNLAARWDARHGKCSASSTDRAAVLGRWYPAQISSLIPQPQQLSFPFYA